MKATVSPQIFIVQRLSCTFMSSLNVCFELAATLTVVYPQTFFGKVQAALAVILPGGLRLGAT
jgi:hypothetical protein